MLCISGSHMWVEGMPMFCYYPSSMISQREGTGSGHLHYPCLCEHGLHLRRKHGRHRFLSVLIFVAGHVCIVCASASSGYVLSLVTGWTQGLASLIWRTWQQAIPYMLKVHCIQLLLTSDMEWLPYMEQLNKLRLHVFNIEMRGKCQNLSHWMAWVRIYFSWSLPV